MKIEKIGFSEKAWLDYEYFQCTNQAKLIKKINELIKNIKHNPYKGLGKPEALKNNLAGYYSRRISDEHRLVYEIIEDTLLIIGCRFHYD